MFSFLAFLPREHAVPLPPEDAVVLPVQLEALPLVAGAGLVERLALPGRVEELAVPAHPVKLGP